MRHLVILLGTLGLAACSVSPGTRSESEAVGASVAPVPEPEDASRDSALQFLLTAAAADFHEHRPPDPARFRDVRLGHIKTSGGEKQFMLCGQFLATGPGGEENWTAFATIRTSPYEQWTGGQAAGLCRDSSVVWVKLGDLSSLLQRRLDAMR